MRYVVSRAAFISEDDTEILRDDALGVIVVCAPNGLHFKAFSGKRQRPDLNWNMRTVEARDLAINKWYQALKAKAEAKAARRAELQASGHGVEVGDVLRCSWGYDQTNQDYYQVIRLIGKQTVEIRQIDSLKEPTGYESGIAVPKLDAFVGGSLQRRSGRDGVIRIDDGRYARKESYKLVNGVRVFTPSAWSSYA